MDFPGDAPRLLTGHSHACSGELTGVSRAHSQATPRQQKTRYAIVTGFADSVVLVKLHERRVTNTALNHDGSFLPLPPIFACGIMLVKPLLLYAGLGLVFL